MKERMKFSTYKFIIYLSLLFLCLMSCSISNKETKSFHRERPNILLILCDDLGYHDVGFNGATDIKTPSLDRLAKNGTIFSSAYVAHPFCGPSRASLMTGRYAHKIGVQFNLPPNSETIGEGIPLSEIFISKVLQGSGYHTGLVGKWHLGAIEKYHPNNRGFDDFYGFLGGGHDYFPAKYRQEYARQKQSGREVIFEYLLPLEHNGKAVNETEYLTDDFSNQAIKFVENAEEKENPFFLFLSYNAPHTPLEAKEEDLEKYSFIKDEKRRIYAAMVHTVDRGVGRIVESLEASGALENTLIVFLSDNGGKTIAGANNYPLRDGKGSTCEGGYRVPMFFHWPKVVPGGQTFRHPISALDLYPTFAGLAQAVIPKGKELDGKDIWASFMAGKNAHSDENIYAMRHREGYTDVGVRNGPWKALKVNQQPWALYDLDKDISEQNNLSSANSAKLIEMVRKAENWSQSHIQPRWFHDISTGIEWREKEMPHFKETFEMEGISQSMK